MSKSAEGEVHLKNEFFFLPFQAENLLLDENFNIKIAGRHIFQENEFFLVYRCMWYM